MSKVDVSDNVFLIKEFPSLSSSHPSSNKKGENARRKQYECKVKSTLLILISPFSLTCPLYLGSATTCVDVDQTLMSFFEKYARICCDGQRVMKQFVKLEKLYNTIVILSREKTERQTK